MHSIDSIQFHRRRKHKRRSTTNPHDLEFLVIWKDRETTWETYDNVKDTIALHQYIRSKDKVPDFLIEKTMLPCPRIGPADSETEYFIDRIYHHRYIPKYPGLLNNLRNFVFLVSWWNYPLEYDSWEPYDNLKHTSALNEYLSLRQPFFTD